MATYHQTHAFQARPKPMTKFCVICGRVEVHILHGHQTFAGMEAVDNEREEARELAYAEELTKILRSPKADVSEKAGRMEREAPLFFGTGENPTLF